MVRALLLASLILTLVSNPAALDDLRYTTGK
jgi:hypothetical protein